VCTDRVCKANLVHRRAVAEQHWEPLDLEASIGELKMRGCDLSHRDVGASQLHSGFMPTRAAGCKWFVSS
jgi:hypothetical protein